MISYFGDFAEDDTVLIPFNTFTSDDPAASSTITDLADADIKVHKDGGTTPIATDGATVAINFPSGGVTGNHLITIDTSADAAYATGSEYAVRIEGTTVDGATINAWVGAFSIERAGGVLALLKGAGGLSDINTDVEAILADTGTDGVVIAAAQTVATVTDVTNGVSLANGAITDASLAGNMEVVFETDFATNYNATRNAWATNLQDTVGTGNLTADVVAISGDTTAADRLEEAATSVITGTVDAAPTPTTTAFGFTGTNGHTEAAVNDYYNGKIITFLDGNLAGQSTDITDYAATNNVFTVTALTSAPSSGDAFTIT